MKNKLLFTDLVLKHLCHINKDKKWLFENSHITESMFSNWKYITVPSLDNIYKLSKLLKENGAYINNPKYLMYNNMPFTFKKSCKYAKCNIKNIILKNKLEVCDFVNSEQRFSPSTISHLKRGRLPDRKNIKKLYDFFSKRGLIKSPLDFIEFDKI